MYSLKVLLASKDGVKKFVNAAEKMTCDIDIGYGHYIVDGKSIIGVMNMDISQKLEVTLHTNNQEEIDNFINNITELLV